MKKELKSDAIKARAILNGVGYILEIFCFVLSGFVLFISPFFSIFFFVVGFILSVFVGESIGKNAVEKYKLEKK